MTKTFRTRFFDKICPWDGMLAIAFGVNVVLLVMLGLSVLLGPQSAGTMVVIQLTLALIVVTLAIVTPLLLVCRRRSGIDSDAGADRDN